MTAAQLARLHRRRALAVRREVRKTTRSIGQNALATARMLLIDRIYGLDVDRTPAGRAKWVRTRQLLNNERYEQQGDDAVALVNPTPYATPRHEAGKPGRRQINPVRVVHWRDEMLEIMRPIAMEAWRLAVRDALRNP